MWEYDVHFYPIAQDEFRLLKMKQFLDHYGDLGWELVQVIDHVFIFKRHYSNKKGH